MEESNKEIKKSTYGYEKRHISNESDGRFPGWDFYRHTLLLQDADYRVNRDLSKYTFDLVTACLKTFPWSMGGFF